MKLVIERPYGKIELDDVYSGKYIIVSLTDMAKYNDNTEAREVFTLNDEEIEQLKNFLE